MRWLQNISFSSSSSSSLKSSSVQGFPTSPTRNSRERRGLRFAAPRLTRQRKLRHLTDEDVLNDPRTSASASAVLARTCSSAVPLPLPLPLPEGDGELRFCTGREVGNVKNVDGEPRFYSAREVGNGKCVESGEPRFCSSREGGNGRIVDERDSDREKDEDYGRDRDRVANPPFGSVFTSDRHLRKKSENSAARSPIQSRRELTNVDSARETCWVNVPTRSAPTSPFSSPAISPHRSPADVAPYYNMVLKGNQVWSAPEMMLDMSGLPPPAFFDYTAFSADTSPIQSPSNISPSRQSLSPTGPPSPLHPKLSPVSSSALRETSNVHPLPLPPGAAMLSPPAPAHQVPSKAESVPMKSHWQKGKLIGRGTFGSVYVASNRETGALCAMKEVELFPDDPKSAECIKQLEQEIKVLSQLQHPNIVQYYGSETAGDSFFIYLEFVHPGSINKYIRDHCGAITESVVRNFTRHILSGLAYLHSKKTVHRDIKGANLLVDASGVVKLADFGMAKHLTGQRADLSLKGSPYWMAPELMQAVMQKDTNSDLAFAVDIWSLGCTIIEMFTGKPPWSEYEGAAAMFKVMRDTPPIPESLSPEGKDFLRCCFQRNPAERPLASVLLEHKFMKNSQSQNSLQPSSLHADVSSSSRSVDGMTLMDKAHSSRQRMDFKLDNLPALPNSRSVNQTTSESEPMQRSYYEIPDLTLTSRYSPRSILEALPSPSPTGSSYRMPSAQTVNCNSCGTENNSVYR